LSAEYRGLFLFEHPLFSSVVMHVFFIFFLFQFLAYFSEVTSGESISPMENLWTLLLARFCSRRPSKQRENTEERYLSFVYFIC